MRRTSMILLLLFGVPAFALGPIPNGTYKGNEICNGTAYPTTMILSDNTLKWDDQTTAFDFGPNSNGFFSLRSVSGMAGSGLGHFTTDGLHYEVVYNYVEADGSSHSAPGEDTLSYVNGKIHLDASASAGPGGKFVCTGDFSRVP